ncbi:MlaC/ttg2D family ABC transporter substrate-binding protein [Pseudothauera rhizosphaerae]|uniref:ABC transporter substrate-binding protein n=1 Tax=Pseudothauera rhizosphaerae TaxID=2565932 RepID=A0A4S4AQZ0_9RHOO|nr:ABC transporter substrate-binding protein [Pseudothauera rhizosphaerae]THF61717.1 ABC transporter substrate-binding protein [Pseudothauera rhizosphaerae]
MKALILGFSLSLAALLPAQAAVTPPDDLVRSVTGEVLEIVRSDRDIQGGDTAKILALVDEKVLPHFNFRRMTMLAVGRDWRQATPEQQAQLTDAFRTLLVRTYSNALTQYRDQVIEFRPLRAGAADTTVQVRTEVRQPGAQPVAIDYVLERTDAGWKVFDVIVAGVSLVTNYRGTFTQEVRTGGIEGLIRSLENRNRELAEGAARS